jgi:hypothetical protein
MLLAVACFLMLILSAGCAALSPMTEKQETLEERVKNYMQAQIDRKWDRVYSYFDSSSREKTTREGYVNRARNLSYTGFSIEEVTMLPSGDQATVKVKIDMSFMGYNFKGAPQTQNWIKETGTWFVKSAPQSQKNPFAPQEKHK